MKEHMRPPIINRDGYASLELTRHAQTPYPRPGEGDIFMPDGTPPPDAKTPGHRPEGTSVPELHRGGNNPSEQHQGVSRPPEINPFNPDPENMGGQGQLPEQLDDVRARIQQESGDPRSVLHQENNGSQNQSNEENQNEQEGRSFFGELHPLPTVDPDTLPEDVRSQYQQLVSKYEQIAAQDSAGLFGNFDQIQEAVRELAGYFPSVEEIQNTEVQQRTREAVNGMISVVQRERARQEEALQLRDTEREIYQRRHSLYGERELSTDDIEELIMNPELDTEGEHTERKLESLFNRIFDRVDSQPRLQFGDAMGSAGNKEWQDFQRFLNEASSNPTENKYIRLDFVRDELTQMQGEEASDEQAKSVIEDRRRRLQERAAHYVDLYNTRQMLHDANFAVLRNVGVEQLYNYVSGFQTGNADMVFRKRGVQEAYRFYTQALLRIKSRYGGYIPETAMLSDPNDIFAKGGGEVDKIARKLFTSAMEAGVIKDPQTGEIIQMQEDEISSAFEYARGLGIMMGTTTEIAATSDIPHHNPYVGLFAQSIVQNVQVFRTMHKYNIGGKGNAILGMQLDRKGRWTRDELVDFRHDYEKDKQKTFAIMNGVLEEEDKSDRLIEMLNPFGVGGIVSKSTWRAGNDPFTGSLSQLAQEDMDWVGSGLNIELKRDDLNSDEREKREDAERTIRHHLDRMARIQPLVLYNNDRQTQSKVLEEMYGDTFRDLGVMLERRGQERAEGDDEKIQKDLEIHKDYFKYRTKYKIDNRDIHGWDEGFLQELKATNLYKESAPLREGEAFDENNFRHQVDGLIEKLTGLSEKASVLQEAALQRRVEDFGELDSDGSRMRKVYKSDGTWTEEAFTYKGIDMSDSGNQEALRFARAVQKHFSVDTYVDMLKKREYKLPFVLDVTGLDNHEIFWAKGGDKAIARRWEDMSYSEPTAKALMEFVTGLKTYDSPEKVAEGLQTVFDALKGYDDGIAKDVTKKLGEAAMKFYSKDWYYRVPGGGLLGLTKGAVSGISASQSLLGNDAMAWDEVDTNKLSAIMRSHGTWALDDQRDVQKKTIGKRRKLIAAYARFGIPVAVLAGLLFLNAQELEDES